jgi:DNA-directed RNA polymerase subunit K/omega
MLRRGARPLVESLEKLDFEDIALREIFEGRITYDLGSPDARLQRFAPIPPSP